RGPSGSPWSRTVATGWARSSSPRWGTPSSTSRSPRPSSTIRKGTAAMADTTHSARTVDLDALRVSPAAHLSEQMSRASAAGGDAVALRELPFTVQVGLRAQPGTASGAALEEAYGLPLPRSVGEVTGDGARLHILG